MTAVDTGQVFLLPDLGEGLADAEIVAWRVSVGDQVRVDDVVVEVETAKATVEVPCPYAGRVIARHGEPGQVVAVGQPLLSVAPAEAPGSGAVLVGYGTGGTAGGRRRGRATRRPPAVAAGAETVAPRVISPVVRRLAAEHGVALGGLTGSGPAGVVLRRDVESAIALSVPHVITPAAPASAPASATAPYATAATAEDERIPLRGLRRAVADKLTRSRREIPHATTWVDVDATGLRDARTAVQAAYPDRPVGLLALLARFVVAGLARYPELNVSVDVEREEIVRHGAVHLGFAAQTDRGLVVPVVRDAHRMTTAELGDELARLTELAREGRLTPEQLTGGTFTLNNYGVFGVDGSTPIINHPEAALLGVGRIVDKPWVVNGELAVRKVTQLSLTFDHRVCDGGVAGGFLRFVADAVERPAGLLGGL